MSKTKDCKKQYSDFSRFVIGLFGIFFLISFFAELYQIILKNDTYFLMLTPLLGCLGYLFSYTAYRGHAPLWFEDKNIIGSKHR